MAGDLINELTDMALYFEEQAEPETAYERDAKTCRVAIAEIKNLRALLEAEWAITAALKTELEIAYDRE